MLTITKPPPFTRHTKQMSAFLIYLSWLPHTVGVVTANYAI